MGSFPKARQVVVAELGVTPRPISLQSLAPSPGHMPAPHPAASTLAQLALLETPLCAQP